MRDDHENFRTEPIPRMHRFSLDAGYNVRKQPIVHQWNS